MSAAKKLRTLLAGNRALIAPAVFNPLSAKLAEAAGFEVLYLGGGTIGYLNGCLEANLNITQLCQVGIEIRAASNLPWPAITLFCPSTRIGEPQPNSAMLAAICATCASECCLALRA